MSHSTWGTGDEAPESSAKERRREKLLALLPVLGTVSQAGVQAALRSLGPYTPLMPVPTGPMVRGDGVIGCYWGPARRRVPAFYAHQLPGT
jgi:hypothetical protein